MAETLDKFAVFEQYRIAAKRLTAFLRERSQMAYDNDSTRERRKLSDNRLESFEPADIDRKIHGSEDHQRETMAGYWRNYNFALDAAVSNLRRLGYLDLEDQLAVNTAHNVEALWSVTARLASKLKVLSDEYYNQAE